MGERGEGWGFDGVPFNGDSAMITTVKRKFF